MQEQNEDLSFVSFPLHSLYAHCTALAMTLESHGWEKSLRLGLGAGERRKVSKISMDSNGNSIKLSSLGMGQLPGLLCPAILTQGAAWNGEGMETAFDRSRRAVRDTWRRDLRGERACSSFCMSSSDSATVSPRPHTCRVLELRGHRTGLCTPVKWPLGQGFAGPEGDGKMKGEVGVGGAFWYTGGGDRLRTR